MAIVKITITNDDGSTQDFFEPVAPPDIPAPTQVIEVHAGEFIEVKGV